MKLSLKSAYFVSLVVITLSVSSCYPAHTGSGDTFGSGSGSSSSFRIGGTVSGLSGTGLVLLDNGGDNLTITTGGAFNFKTLIAKGNTYGVTVLAQPSNPAQTCLVSSGVGTATVTVTTVQVTCSTATTGNGNIIGGQVTGLQGTGLVLQDNLADNLPVKASGPFNFATTIANGAAYSVTVLTQPTNPTQTCTVANGSGVASGNVGNIVVTCSSGTLSLGGSVSGLAGSGLVLANTNGDAISISGNGNFTFPILLVSGTTYNVTIKSQPINPAQICAISGNTGTATTNVNTIQVVCPAVFHTIGGQVIGLYVPTGQVSDMVLQNNGGDNLPVTGNGAFTFVTPIAHASAYDVSVFVQPSSQPGVSCIIVGWSGVALSNVTNVTIDCGHNDWAWIDGPNKSNSDEVVSKPPVDHTKQDSDTPGGSKYSAGWTDSTPNHNLWLFTGSSHAIGFPNVGAFFGEMWEYVGTQNYDGGLGNYWTQVAASSSPMARWGAVTWTDGAGNFWLYGGQDAFDDFLNDLWTFNPSTLTWTFVSAGPTVNGAYGTKGTAGPNNFPGARWGATARRDPTTGTVWMFGGFGFDGSSAAPGLLNDLWTFNGTQWTWISGSKLTNQSGVNGTLGVPALTNVPGGREEPVSWIDNTGNFWMFGGFDLSPQNQPNAFNDLWEFSGGQWTWQSGANFVNQTATYGNQGVAAAGNVPGARWNPAAWSDVHGNFWLFGGVGYDATANGTLADLWEYKGGQWIWVKGPSSVAQTGIYGTAANPVFWPLVTNSPGSRWGATYWVTPQGFAPPMFWMFGGEGFDSSSGGGDQLLSDLWRYLPYP
jgi:hypothetical protein